MCRRRWAARSPRRERSDLRSSYRMALFMGAILVLFIRMDLRLLIRQIVLENVAIDNHIEQNNSLSNFTIKGSPDDVSEVAEANGMTVGMEKCEVPVSELQGGCDLAQPSERRRVDLLKQKIMSDDGYIARIIIDAHNNVVEGQHRLEALRELGFDKAPAVRLIGESDMIGDVGAVEAAIKSCGPIHPDHLGGIIRNLASILYDEKGDVGEVLNYGAPRGFERQWKAAIEAVGQSRSDV